MYEQQKRELARTWVAAKAAARAAVGAGVFGPIDCHVALQLEVQGPEVKLDGGALDLRGNRLGARTGNGAGAAALVPALIHPYCRLATLDLSENRLGDVGATALVSALTHPQARHTATTTILG